VEEILGDGGIRAKYYFGFGDAMHSKPLIGRFNGNDTISFRDDEGSIFEFKQIGDNLSANFTGRSGTLTGSFHRPYTPNIN